ncbi:MAG TPA: chlorite dismutase family protein [Polyangiaceae bacterium]
MQFERESPTIALEAGAFLAAIIPVSFVGAETGQYRVLRMNAVVGAPLAPVAAVTVHPLHLPPTASPGAAWVLRGSHSAVRYVERPEAEALKLVQPGLGRPECSHAALIPIRKSDAWWNLAQDERRAIFETRSSHIASCLEYLPAIARRLHHSRELGEPFDFLTWFEYAAEHVALFDELVQLLRATEEWQYVDWEVDIRLTRNG